MAPDDVDDEMAKADEANGEGRADRRPPDGSVNDTEDRDGRDESPA